MAGHYLVELITEKDIRSKVKELGRQISRDYETKSVFVIGVLKGSFVFLADLIRELDIPAEVSFISLSSYAEGTTTSGSVRLLRGIDEQLEGRDLLIVEDIVDSGHTVAYLVEALGLRNPNSVRICALLDKPARRVLSVRTDYYGFEIGDEFVVGYGLDYAGKYRNLKSISKVVFSE